MVGKLQEVLAHGRKALDSHSRKANQEVERSVKDKKKRAVDINILEVGYQLVKVENN
jgi:hypothetical protein